MPDLPQPIKGFGTTFLTQFRKVVTEQYPEEKDKYPPKPRFHGRHQLNRHPDGLEKCIGCELCAWACPADAIYVEGAPNTDEQRFSPGERYGRVYQINYLRCILCGLCIEACPTRALTMTNEYELADNMWGREFLPQTSLMPMVDLVITHGGNNTTTEALHFGKPMVLLPLFWDQYDNAQRMDELGFGRRLRTYEFTEAKEAIAWRNLERLLEEVCP